MNIVKKWKSVEREKLEGVIGNVSILWQDENYTQNKIW